MLHKNVFNNSYSKPISFSRDKLLNIFIPIEHRDIKKVRRAKTYRLIVFNYRKLIKNSTNRNKKVFRKSKESVVLTFNANTWVNRLPFVYLDNRKTKNYEKIYFEVLKLFENKNKEKEEDIKYSRLYNNSSQKNLNLAENDLDTYYGVTDYINIIKKPPNVRTMHDIFLTIHFLSKTKLGRSFKDEFVNDEIYGKLITFCSMEIKYKKFKRGQKIFNIGDLPDYFYIILNGKVDIIKPLQTRVSMTGNEYFLYLMKLLKNNDRYTYNLCIENNDLNFVIDKNEEKLLPYIYISINLAKKKSELFFKEILNSINISPKELGLTENEALDDIYIIKNVDRIKFFFPYNITSDLVDKYYFISDTFIQKNVYIYHDQKFLSLDSNCHFGDSAMDGRTTRNATIVANEETEVGYIEMPLYHAYISQEKIKLIHKRLKFLLENFFFKRITTNSFEKKYFNFFISNNYLKGDVLFNENNKSGFAYFIENGIVELSTSKSVIEMQMLIKLLQTKRSNIERFFSHFQQENEQELLYNNIENNCGDLIKYIKKKEKNKIIILKDNEDIGLISFFYDCPYIADCTVVSNTAKIYKIDFKYLNQILANENQCVYDLIKRINHKLKLFQERLFNINNIKLSIADKEETMKNKEKMELIREEMIKVENQKKEKKKNIKNKEKENKAEIEKFHDICANFYTNKINKYISSNNKNKNNLNNSFLPSIKTDRALNNDKERLKYHILFNKIFSKNQNKINKENKKNRSQFNKLFVQKNNHKKSIRINKFSNNLFGEISKGNKNNKNELYLKASLIHMKSINIDAKKKEIFTDAFLKYYKNYACNTGPLNSSLIFNKIKFNVGRKRNKEKENSDNYNQILSSSVINQNNEYLSSRNQKLTSVNSKDNIFSSSQKITSKNIVKDMTSYNKIKKMNFMKIDKSTIMNSLNKETERNESEQIKAYSDRKMVNKNINHPYYSPSVLIKKLKYEVFLKNIKKIDKITVKSNKDFGFYNFSLEKSNPIKKSA